MKKIKNYNDFCNEEIDMKKVMIGGALIGGIIAGSNAISKSDKTRATYQETELANFPEYHVHTAKLYDDNLDVTINKNDGTIGTRRAAGKHDDYSVTVDGDISTIYYKRSSWGVYIYASTNQNDLPGSEPVNLSEMEVIEETDQYKILEVPSFWSSFDYIFVNKGYENKENEFEMGGETYTYYEPNFGFSKGKAAFVVKCK